MVEIEQNPDYEQRRRIMDMTMAAGKLLLENGAEVFRVEQTMTIMARSYHLREFDVYVLTNGIFASAGTAEISEVRNVPNRSVHLGRVAAVNALSREIAAGTVPLAEAEARLADIQRMPVASDRAQVLASAFGSACFAILFGGGAVDSLVALAAGAALGAFLIVCNRRSVYGMMQRMAGAALLTVICLLVSAAAAGAQPSCSIIGTLMVLTPGVAFTMGIRDFVKGDYLSGTIRMIDALLVAASIACGTGFVMMVYEWLTGGAAL